MAQSRKRRKERQKAAAEGRGRYQSPDDRNRPHPPEDEPSPAGYARSRAKDEAARAALKPLGPAERPTVVTIGAVVAALLGLANVIAVVAGWDGAAGEDDRGRALALSLLTSGVLLVVAWGMWKAKYWAVLGMQTLLALTILAAALGLVTAASVRAAIILLLILVGAGALFWFMVKAMARIQMPERPSRAR